MRKYGLEIEAVRKKKIFCWMNVSRVADPIIYRSNSCAGVNKHFFMLKSLPTKPSTNFLKRINFEIKEAYSTMPKIATEVILFHVLWACTAVLVLTPPDSLKTLAPDVGTRIFYNLLFYNIGLAVTSLIFKRREEFDIWMFCIILSVMQVLPDWFLSAQLKTLVFPDKSFPKIGSVSAYMALAWSPVFFMTIFITRALSGTHRTWSYAVAALISSTILWLAESDLANLKMWKATHVEHYLLHKNIAAYVLLPETLLGITAYAVYNWTTTAKSGFERFGAKLFGALFVMLSYTGALALSYFFIETRPKIN